MSEGQEPSGDTAKSTGPLPSGCIGCAVGLGLAAGMIFSILHWCGVSVSRVAL
jgi:hypothetical protein